MQQQSTAVMLKPEKIGDSIKFADLVKVLEAVNNDPQASNRSKRVVKFISKCRDYFKLLHGTLDSAEANGDSLFPLIRILLLKLDRERPAYGLQAKSLGKILASVLGLNDRDKARLTNFRSPDANDETGGGSGDTDFASVLYSIMQARFSDQAPSVISLTGLHDILDKLSRDAQTNQEAQKKVLLELFTGRKLSPLEGKWLCRILLKNLECGVNRNIIFKAIHPKAYSMYERISNLKKVCETLNDPDFVIKDIDKIVLFYYVKPMLCLRTNTLDDFESFNDEHGTTSSSSRAPTANSSPSKKKPNPQMAPPYVIETKWDGERFQIHYDGRSLKYISKQGHDYTLKFNVTLTPRLAPQIKLGARSWILDGEMMAWDKRNKGFTQKGADIDVKNFRPDNLNHCPTYVAFDVLMFNDVTLINKPLHVRYATLEKILNPKESVVLVPKQNVVNTREQVEDALNKAIDESEEGLVIKAIDSVYEPGKRGPSWRKIKPEFIYGTSVDDLDLLILGAYYSESTRRKGIIGNFLVGVIKKSGNTEEFFALTQVGSGQLRIASMKALVDELQPHLGKKPFPGINYKAKQRPDLYIDPKKSIVVQVKASEIIYSKASALDYNLRFPRITVVRKDKNYNQIMTVEEFHTLRESCGGRLAKRTDNRKFFGAKKRGSADANPDTSDEDEPTSKVAKRTLPVARIKKNNNYSTSSDEDDDEKPSTSSALMSKSKSRKPAVIAPVPLPKILPAKPIIKKDIFKAKIFCVLGKPAWKTKIEEEITSYGGQIVQNLIKERLFYVGESLKNPKVDKAVRWGKHDVLKPDWIQRCIASGAEVPFTPADFYIYAEEIAAIFKTEYDEYGDSYKKECSLQEVKDLAKKVIALTEANRKNGKSNKNDSDEDEVPDDDDMDIDYIRDEIEPELFPGPKINTLKQYRFFKDVRVAFRGETDPVLAAMITFYGGTVASSEVEKDDSNSITHVVVKDPLSPSKKKQLSAFLIKPRWITESVEKRKCLDEIGYSAGCLV